ncbi:hypothetical protein Droror1_Dr00011625 [Drosera rotundifolia]
MANVEIASGGGGRSLLGRRPESPSIDNRNTPHIEGEIPVPNLPNILPLDGVPFGKSTSTSSSSSPCAVEETGYRPPEKPTSQAYFGIMVNHFPLAQLRSDPSIAYLVRGKYEKMCEKNAAEIADMERRLQMERKMIQCISRSRVLQLHVKFLCKMGLFKKRTNGGIGYAGDFQRGVDLNLISIDRKYQLGKDQLEDG